MAQIAWNYVNDSLRLDLCLRFKAQEIACSAVFLAVQKTCFTVPVYSSWWKIMDTELDTIIEISNKILDLYEIPKVGYCLHVKDYVVISV